MNDDEIRALLDKYSGSVAYADRRVCNLAAEVLRRGEIIATYRRVIDLLDPTEKARAVRALSTGERALLEGEAP